MSRVDAPGTNWTALIIDDDDALRGMLTSIMMRDGFTVDTASSGREAFEYLRRGSYSVILLDLMMPDINGFELLERLERDSPALLRRVIVMTGASSRLVDGLDVSRVWGAVRKPFDVNDLVRAARVCASGRPRVERRREPRPEQRP